MRHRCAFCSTPAAKRETVLLPLALPRLTDKGAVELVVLLQELVGAIAHHYRAQIDRYHRRQRELHRARQSPPATPDDPPF